MNGVSRSLLTTDLYQLTMLQAYWQHQMDDVAVFELFVRKLPPGRRFLVAAGLAPALDWIEAARFSADELSWIEHSGRFAPGFVAWLARLRFTGDLWAMPEGTPFFADEPIVRVVAPIAQAQLLETRLLNLVHFQTVIASKAVRAVSAARGRSLIDFGLRRAHGAEAGVLAARAAYLAGFDGTATAAAGHRFGVPVFGTMAHSFVQAFDDEAQAFTAFAESFPGHAVLLLDTYDTVAAATTVARLAPAFAARGIAIKGVRLDSGDLAVLARAVRAVLDAAGLNTVTIFASGNLDEFRIDELLAAGAPIDGFGVGTSLTTAADAPCIDAVYKLQEYGGSARRKRSTGKATWPGRKQVWRQLEPDGTFAGDRVTLADESVPQARPLLVEVMRSGRRLAPSPPLTAARAYCAAQRAALPPQLKVLDRREDGDLYPVEISPRIRALAAFLDRKRAVSPAITPLSPTPLDRLQESPR